MSSADGLCFIHSRSFYKHFIRSFACDNVLRFLNVSLRNVNAQKQKTKKVGCRFFRHGKPNLHNIYVSVRACVFLRLINKVFVPRYNTVIFFFFFAFCSLYSIHVYA